MSNIGWLFRDDILEYPRLETIVSSVQYSPDLLRAAQKLYEAATKIMFGTIPHAARDGLTNVRLVPIELLETLGSSLELCREELKKHRERTKNASSQV